MVYPELLAPAGNLEKLRTALLYGANAMYLGGTTFNLRAACAGFTAQELAVGVQEANTHQAKVYYCLNSLPVQQDLATLPAVIEQAAQAGVHAFIIADPGVLRLARKYAPHIEVHLSTQANTTNAESILFWADQGVSRVNLARELSARDIYAVRRANLGVELEVFVHGAMCLAVSGNCLLSAWLNNRPANMGQCTHPCRFEYRAKALDSVVPELEESRYFEGTLLQVEESMRPGQVAWNVRQHESFSSFWAPEDLCLLPYLPWFVETGIHALKIEGRMKSAAYVAHVVDAYRTALDAIRVIREGADQRDTLQPFSPETYMPEVFYTASRFLGTGFFVPGKRRRLTEEFLAKQAACGAAVHTHAGGSKDAMPNFGHSLLAVLTEKIHDGSWRFEARGTWRSDMGVELMLPGMQRPKLAAGCYTLENHRGEKTDKVGSGIRGVLHANIPGARPGVFIRGSQ